MKMNGGPASLKIKITLLVIAVVISISTLLYTQNLVESLQKRERQIVELYANSLRYIANPNTRLGDYTFLMENIIKRIDFPLILTDGNDNINFTGTDNGIRNIDIDSSLSNEQQTAFLKKKLLELAEENNPILVTLNDTIVLSKIYYGNSELINRLKIYPYLQIIFAFFFIIIAYVSFSYLKKTEQSNIWVGMAKETAHQLGTPISSLMGWYEYLKISADSKEKVLDIAEEINSDLFRLNKIAKRFSKIGSKPELKETNLNDVIRNVTNYFQRRLPHSGKSISLNVAQNLNVSVPLNAELFEWVIENLIKNAIDAIDNKNGKIDISINDLESNIEILISDNGKGIDPKRKKDVFRPGYSTKRRGWGLGLSLAKRIVENYHKGKIFVKQTQPGKGTTFCIHIAKKS